METSLLKMQGSRQLVLQETLDVPRGTETIDVSGKTIVPGFVDTHAHMWPSWGTS